ncbi:MAG: dienelactone hydrolase family protein [Acidobacteriaceae bacterium]
MRAARWQLYLSILCIGFLCKAPLRAQTKSSVQQTKSSAQKTAVIGPKNVSFQSGNETVHGVLYQPQGAGPFPAIIIIHEWWGLNDWVKQQAKMFAEHGYVTLAVDLYRGQVATDTETAHELMRALPQDRGVMYLKSALAYLKTLKTVEPDRIGADGWCMGGSFAMQFAVAAPSLRAVAINYGAPETDPAQLKKIHAAILGNFGALDRGITPEDVKNFAAEMKEIGHPVDVKEYADAGHAFENPTNKSGYRAVDTEDADRRMFIFFSRTLQH